MRNTSPYHQCVELLKGRKAPETSIERSLYVLAHGVEALNAKCPHKQWSKDQLVDPTCAYAWEIYCNPTLKPILEAFLFATNDDSDIMEALGLELQEVALYREVFFDTSVFRNDLERAAWMQTFEEESPTKELFKVAYHQGFKALRWHYCRDKGNISPEEAEQIILLDSVFSFLKHRGKGLTSEMSKEARHQSKAVLETIKAMRSKGEVHQGDSESIRFLFASAKPNKTKADLIKDGIEVMN